MNGRRRLVGVASAALAAVLSGGVAWGVSGGHVPASSVRVADTASTDPSSSTDVTVPSTDTTDTTAPVTDTTDTTVPVTDTTVPTTDTTDTTVPSTDTTVVEPSTTSTSIAPVTTTSLPAPCKPGWGWGDTNHCHSGPPGLLKHHGHGKH